MTSIADARAVIPTIPVSAPDYHTMDKRHTYALSHLQQAMIMRELTRLPFSRQPAARLHVKRKGLQRDAPCSAAARVFISISAPRHFIGAARAYVGADKPAFHAAASWLSYYERSAIIRQASRATAAGPGHRLAAGR